MLWHIATRQGEDRQLRRVTSLFQLQRQEFGPRLAPIVDALAVGD
jgi:hypothetical protein